MKKIIASVFLLAFSIQMQAQNNPVITHWLINTTDLKGRHYVQGNSTPIQDNVLANVQSVQYSNDWVYVDATGIPAYVTGPFLDGNPSLASEQTGYFKLPLNPVQNTGTPTNTTGGNIGAFINGVALFDYRDGVAWNPNTNSLCGGPGNPPCPGGMGAQQAWNRDAIPAERDGFDCSKAHPAMGNYHHHQNPSAFNLDKLVISNICDLYPADGLYAIDSTAHSPLIGFAYDGFPIYGAHGFKNPDGTGGIVRIKSSYQKRNITVRTHSPAGVDVPDGPPVSATYPLGYFREDYEYVLHTEPDYLDEHNGRFCVTPEYPNGIYCYFATVDANWNSAYPYAVGPTFYGVKSASKVQTITEAVTTYNPTSAVHELGEDLKLSIFPNPASDFIAVQASGILREKMEIRLFDLSGKWMQTAEIQPGSTIAYFDCSALYNGVYLVSVEQNGQVLSTEKVSVKKD
ncbi:MAG: YHYH protein [Bacteroidota bacterium]